MEALMPAMKSTENVLVPVYWRLLDVAQWPYNNKGCCC
jgi:hypothetical protein